MTREKEPPSFVGVFDVESRAYVAKLRIGVRPGVADLMARVNQARAKYPDAERYRLDALYTTEA